jgi:hypothetical protein
MIWAVQHDVPFNSLTLGNEDHELSFANVFKIDVLKKNKAILNDFLEPTVYFRKST